MTFFIIKHSLQQSSTQYSTYNAVFSSIQLSLQHTTLSSIGFQQSRFTQRKTPATCTSTSVSRSRFFQKMSIPYQYNIWIHIYITFYKI